MSTPPLLSLPVELLLLIFSYACIDGGQTGCAINSVCQYLRTTCLKTGADLQSAAVHGIDRMDAFLEVLKRRDEGGQQVVSLLLRRDKKQEGDIKKYAHLLTKILRTINPHTLRILYVSYPYSSFTFLASLIDVSFPSAVEFRIGGFIEEYKSNTISSSATDMGFDLWFALDLGADLTQVFPRIASFSIESSSQDEYGDDLLRFLGAYCRLDMRRCSEFMDVGVLQSHALLDPDAPEVHIPPALQHVTITIAPFTPKGLRLTEDEKRNRDAHSGLLIAFHMVNVLRRSPLMQPLFNAVAGASQQNTEWFLGSDRQLVISRSPPLTNSVKKMENRRRREIEQEVKEWREANAK
ncbi:hypothetical protein EIP91_001711 [Steccherinum ochraceum]|uniref:F-box domain-containing protein n=1 Tax=Steccherinum ochraceum TaxID=92696 RepID=A0A4V2MWG5_9APHY|nr:hypothetical protein EIP91_001711 [Steccherinum ochraceum]